MRQNGFCTPAGGKLFCIRPRAPSPAAGDKKAAGLKPAAGGGQKREARPDGRTSLLFIIVKNGAVVKETNRDILGQNGTNEDSRKKFLRLYSLSKLPQPGQRLGGSP